MGLCDLIGRALAEQNKKLTPAVLNPETTIEHWNDKLMTDWRFWLNNWMTHHEDIELGFFFHVHPDHTVGHLHMHCFALNAALRTNRAHDTKCVPVEAIINVI